MFLFFCCDIKSQASVIEILRRKASRREGVTHACSSSVHLLISFQRFITHLFNLTTKGSSQQTYKDSHKSHEIHDHKMHPTHIMCPSEERLAPIVRLSDGKCSFLIICLFLHITLSAGEPYTTLSGNQHSPVHTTPVAINVWVFKFLACLQTGI